MKATKNIDAWRLVAELGEGGGYKAASVKLGLDFPTCTRLMQKLEAELGTELVVRNVRPAQLTDAGKFLLTSARAVSQAHEEALQCAVSLAEVPMMIRLSIPVNCPRESIHELIQNYGREFPAFAVEILSDMNHADVLTGRADLAMLPYRPPADGLVIWELGKSFNVLLASPRYLHEHGEPKTPADMIHHDVILRSGDYYPKSSFLMRGEETVPFGFRHAAFSGDVMSGKEALLKGEGIAVSLSIATCRKELESGEVVPVLQGWHRPDWEMTLVMSRNHLGNQRLVRFAQAFVKSESEAIGRRRTENLALLSRLADRKARGNQLSA